MVIEILNDHIMKIVLLIELVLGLAIIKFVPCKHTNKLYWNIYICLYRYWNRLGCIYGII
jgi:hypothetical protein